MSDKAGDIERLEIERDRARDAQKEAALCLAYDLTFRAADPNGEARSHDKASAGLTRRLKAEFVAAHEANEVAFQAWADAWDKARA